MVEATAEKIKLLIVDDIPETRENLRKLLYFETDIEIVGMAANGREAIDQAKQLQPDIALMDINMPDMDGISASQEIAEVAPSCQVIMMSVQSEADYLRRSMLAGAMDFLTKPFTSDELSGSIHRVYEMGSSRRTTAPVMRPDAGPTAPGTTRPDRTPRPGGKLLLLYSPKGGSGCSTIAVNLAIALRQVTSKNVALVDASLQFGDLSAMLHLQANHSMADATKSGKLDVDLLTALLLPHPSDVRVLAAPPVPEAAEAIGADDVKAIFTKLLGEFDYVIVDSWSYLDDIVLAAMDVADRILVVMNPEIPSIKSTKQFFEIAEALEFPLDQVDLILNKVLPRDDIRPERLENHIQHDILVELDYDPKSVRQATNQGLPLIMSEPNHSLSQAFLELARQEVLALEPQPAEEPQEEARPSIEQPKRRTGLFGRLKR
ncbi:MAG: response regulator [Anaerolineae bacterium]|jgi:pilus assembly protein CpaE